MSSKQRVKLPFCQNCGHALDKEENFCPECGQENDNKRQSFGHILVHLVESILHIDSKAALTLKPLLFKPGYLTNEFLKGKRVRYLDPVRTFITIVIVYFIASAFIHPSRNLDVKTIMEIDSIRTREGLPDTTFEMDGLPFKIHFKAPDSSYSSEQLSDTIISEENIFNRLKELSAYGINDPEQLVDSIGEENTFWNRFIYFNMMKAINSDMNEFKDFLKSKMPWVVFAIMPLFALILKLFYWRKELLYVDHLIFSCHLHSFAFFIALIALLTGLVFDVELSFWLLLSILIYMLIAQKNVYRETWPLAIVKTIGISAVYGATAIFSLVVFLVIAFILF